MNRNQLTLLLFLVVVVGVAGLMVYNKRNDFSNEGNPAVGSKLLADFPVNDVASILVEEGTNKLNLAKVEGTWRVRERNDYPANYSQIGEFLLKLKDMKIVQSEKVGPSQLSRFGLVPGEGTNAALVVDFKDQTNKVIQSLLLGKKHMRKSTRPSPYGDDMGGWPDGRYVRVGSGTGTVDLISEPFSNIEPNPAQWLNKDFFKVEKVRSISVDFPVATNSWRVSRETESGEWKLADARADEQLDSTKTSSLSNPLSSPSFSDVDVTSQPGQLGLDKPTTVTLETFDNFTYNLKVGTKTNDNYPLALSVTAQIPGERTPGKDEKAEDKEKLDKEFKDKCKKLEEKLAQEKSYEKWTYLVSSWTLDSLLKERSQLLVEKKDEKPAAEAGHTNAVSPVLEPLPGTSK